MSNGSDQTLDEVLRALAEEDRAQRAPARVEMVLLREFRRRGAGGSRRGCGGGADWGVLIMALRPGPPPREAARPMRTEFIPVAYAEPLRPEESARIVRVRLPRTTLVSFGLPVNPARLDDRIEADVLLGEDNLVRAVRFEQ
jgi:hypothetical protein